MVRMVLTTIRQEQLLSSDLTADEMRKLADFTKQTDSRQITMHLLPGEGCTFTAADGTAYSVWSIHAQAAAQMLNQYFRPHEPAAAELPVRELAAGETGYDSDCTDVQRITDGDELARMAIMNTAKSGVFAADRAIREYAQNIWHVN